MQFPKIHCKSISYRSGFIEVVPNIHPGHVNIEVWNLSSRLRSEGNGHRG